MDDTVDLLEELPANLVTRILHTVSSDKRDLINQLLKFPENSAGSIMTTEYVSLKKTMTIKETMKHIKEVGIHKETIYTCYVLENRRLIGIVSAKDLMTLDDNTFIQDIMETEIISVGTHTDQEETARLFSKYDLLALPVVDLDNRMVGIITVDDAMDVMVDEATEDISIMGAVNPSEKTYFETSVFSHAKNRFLWLLILMLSSTITGTIITQYENAFAAIPLLVSFIPMLMDTGGNCGSQSSTLIIRGLALERDPFQRYFQSHIQRIPCGTACKSWTCTRKRTANFYHVQRFEACSRDWSFPNLHCHFIKDHRLYSATVCEKNQFRSCNHGSSAYHNTRGYLLHHHLFYDCHAHLSALEKIRDITTFCDVPFLFLSYLIDFNPAFRSFDMSHLNSCQCVI